MPSLRSHRGPRLLLGSALWLAACQPNASLPDAAAKQEPTTIAGPAAVEQPPPTPPAPPVTKPPIAEPVTTPPGAPVAAAPTLYPLNLIPLPTHPTTVTPRPVTWQAMTDLLGPVTFTPLRRGVLARSDGKALGAGPTGLVEISFEFPKARIFGTSPADLWHITYYSNDSSMSTVRLQRWVKGKWKPQRIWPFVTRDEFKLWDIDATLFADGRDGRQLVGQLVTDEPRWRSDGQTGFSGDPDTTLKVTRVPNKDDDLTSQPVTEGSPQWMFEIGDGRLYVGVNIRRGDAYHTVVQRSCEGDGCHVHESRAFPTVAGSGSTWRLTSVVRRGQSGASACAKENRLPLGTQNAASHHWLVHLDVDRWIIEQLPGDAHATYLWPLDDGALWAEVQEPAGYALLHRDPQGLWTRASMPEGFDASTPLELAVTDDQRLWLVAKIDDQYSLWETPAVVPPLPPAPAVPSEPPAAAPMQ